MNKEEFLLMNMTDLFEEWQPNDPDFLEEFPETVEEINDLNEMIENEDILTGVKLKRLYQFNVEWSPDEVEEEDEYYMNQALEVIQNMD